MRALNEALSINMQAKIMDLATKRNKSLISLKDIRKISKTVLQKLANV